MKYLYTVCVSNQIEIYKVFSQQMRERVLVFSHVVLTNKGGGVFVLHVQYTGFRRNVIL